MPIAIVGMACRFPCADNVEAYWRLISEGRDAISEVPPERWDVDSYYDPKPGIPGKMSTRWGGFLRDIDRFDAALFKISPREAQWVDPQQRLILEQGWSALEDALIPPTALAGSRTGVFVGISTDDYGVCLLRDYQSLNEYTGTGGCSSIAANRLSYALDLHGPSIALDTACSSSLTSVHLACQSLEAGECDLALGGGVNVILTPDKGIAYSQSQIMALDGRCKPFDARADGFVRGEGCGMLVLKRLDDAERNGDQIRAVILGSAINQDGRSNGLTAPQPASQRRVIESALCSANVAAHEVAYVEAHGTGTALGDPIELNALVSVLSRGRESGNRCVVSSVKSNIGHLEAAAGVASLIKAICALESTTFPGQLHFQKLNPRIDLNPECFEIGVTSQAWETRGRRVAGVNGFGFGGANAHIVLGEYVPSSASLKSNPEQKEVAELLRLSAHDPQSFQDLAAKYSMFLGDENASRLGDCCYSAVIGRATLPFAASVIAESKLEMRQGLETIFKGQSAPNVVTGKVVRSPKKIGVLFTGQGSQRSGMGRELYETETCFREWVNRGREGLRAFETCLPRSVWDPRETLDEDTVRSTAWAQPALYVLEVALWEQWRAWGMRPHAVLGHSVGEYAAAYAAGVFEYEEGLRLVEARGRLTQSLPSGGTMYAVSASLDQVSEGVDGAKGTVSIAAINGPRQIVVSGNVAALEPVVDGFRRQGLRVVPMNVSHAFHSPLLEPMLGGFREVLGGIQFRDPQIPLISNVTGEALQAGEITTDYWCRHATAPVQFLAGLAAMERGGCQGFLELGPQRVLGALGQRCLSNPELEWLSSLKPDGQERKQMLRSLATLDQWGHPINWERIYPSSKYRKQRLPGYAFQRKRYWFDDSGQPDKSVDATRLLGTTGPLSLPGRRVWVAGRTEARFEIRIPDEVPHYLMDHQLNGTPVIPAAAWIEIVCLVAQTAGRQSAIELVEFSISRPLLLRDGTTEAIQSVLESGRFSGFGMRSGPTGAGAVWDSLVSCKLTSGPLSSDLKPAEEGETSLSDAVDVETVYARLEELGLEYGPAFRPLTEVFRGNGRASGRVRLPVGLRYEGVIHPVILDGAFQVLAAIDLESDTLEPWVPIGFERFWIGAPIRDEVEVRAFVSASVENASERLASIELLDLGGRLVGRVTNLRLRKMVIPVTAKELSARSHDWVYQTEWRPKERTVVPKPLEAQNSSRVLIFGEEAQSLQLCRESLMALDRRCDEIRLPVKSDDRSWLTRAGKMTQSYGVKAELTLVFLCPSEPSDEEMQVDCLMHRTQQFRQLIQFAIKRERALTLVLVTQKSQAVHGAADGGGPIGSALWALARCVGFESRQVVCRCLDCDFDSGESDWARIGLELLEGDDEWQVGLRQGRRYVPRLVSAGVDERSERTGQLRLREEGRFESLQWEDLDRRGLADDELEIEVVAAGLNFRDVLHALGQLKSEAASRQVHGVTATPFGFECAGRVVRTGGGVKGWKAGDSVIALGLGCMASHVVVAQSHVAAKPLGWSWEESAALPVAFLTAWHALVDLAQVQPGERVLIHSVAGGVGQAALQIVRLLGAIPLGTASVGKRSFVEAQGVRCVADSRDPAFADVIMENTGEEGVDVVLNSFSGDMLDATLRCVRSGGRFVEIGKLGNLSPKAFAERRPDVAYHIFDLSEMSETQATKIASLFQSLGQALSDGLVPLPLISFAMAEAARGFRFLGQARQIGKVVLRTSAEAQLPIRRDASYLITGGLGALGLATAEALVARGVRSLILLGRRALEESKRDRIQLITRQGVTVKTIQVDVSDFTELARGLKQVSEDMVPIRGLVHAAGSLRDKRLIELSDDDFASVYRAKAQGAWNLHLATRSLNLDFFVQFSSVASCFGSPGQANYAAANGFLDGLAALRLKQKQPILNLNWGPWDGEGMAAKMSRQRTNGLAKLGVEQGTALLLDRGGALGGGAIPVPVDWRSFRAPRGMDGYFEVLRPAVGVAESKGGRFILSEWEAASEGRRRQVLQNYLRQEVASVLGLAGSAKAIDGHLSLLNLGADSLLLMELVSRVERALSIDLPQSELSAEMSVDNLEGLLTGILLSRSEGKESSALNSVSPSSTGQGKASPAAHESIPEIQYEAPALTVNHRKQLARFGLWSRRLWNLQGHGVEHIPSQGPVIFCANHESHFDGLWIASLLPELHREQLCILAKQEHFDYGLNRFVAGLIGAIAIDRGASPSAALAKGLVVLRQGRSLIIHPEGTRSRDGKLLPFRSGAAILAMTAQVPVVPVCLMGAFEVFPADRRLPSLWDYRGRKRHQVRVRFGEPVEQGSGAELTSAALTSRIRERIVQLREEGE